MSKKWIIVLSIFIIFIFWFIYGNGIETMKFVEAKSFVRESQNRLTEISKNILKLKHVQSITRVDNDTYDVYYTNNNIETLKTFTKDSLNSMLNLMEGLNMSSLVNDSLINHFRLDTTSKQVSYELKNNSFVLYSAIAIKGKYQIDSNWIMINIRSK